MILRGATFSDCGQYRYELTRVWAAKPAVAFIMLNPSTANAEYDDATIRKCMGFAERWGYGGLTVVNLFAWRSTDPHVLPTVDDAGGPRNTHYLAKAMREHDRVICGWGKHGTLRNIDRIVTAWMKNTYPGKAHALHINKDGTPMHPLYVKYSTPPVPYEGRTR